MFSDTGSLKRFQSDREAFEALITEAMGDASLVENSLSLTANENSMSATAKRLLSSSLESRYHLGDDGAGGRTTASKQTLLFQKLPGVLRLEQTAQAGAAARLGAAYVDLRPLSGVHAMTLTLLALSEPGDTIYTLPPEAGGHFATPHLAVRSGRKSRFLPWNADRFDIDHLALQTEITATERSLIFLDPGIPLFPIDLRALRAALPPGVRIVYDASHTLGLIYGGQFQDPLREGADVLQGNTHKTFPGPQKALIAVRDAELGAQLKTQIDQGLVSSQHTHHSLALYATLLEMDCFGERYAAQIVRNARALAGALQNEGFDLLERDGVATESHVVVLRPGRGVEANRACELLMQAGFSTNARPYAGEQILRLGVQELTRRGMVESEMRYIGRLFAQLLLHGKRVTDVRAESHGLRRAFSHIQFSFDEECHDEMVVTRFLDSVYGQLPGRLTRNQKARVH